ncbi:type II toxin-antitoxin system HicB family antitoxin [Facilibium subflavum]|uniref:type II toxin-antitoxin system HicB family antitoxin n=1 Tax=Facilibium subflavum TaxID=2219058 RepID=UPI000E64898B|nr:type II toxin-antitoxin system HicB family antitoxin [Facilibium subflavum]
MLKYPFKIVKMHDDDFSYYVIKCLNYQGGYSQADSIEEALENATEVIDLLLEDALENDKVEQPKQAKGDDIYMVAPSLEYAIPAMLKQARQKKGMSAPQVAKALNVPYQNYWRIEKGERKNLTIGTLKRAAAVLGLSIDINFI